MWVLDKPIFLLLLLPIPFLVYLRHFWTKRGGRVMVSTSMWDGEVFRPPATVQSAMLRVAHLAYWLGWVLLVLALAGPTRTTRERIYLTRGIDIMIVLDQSASMAAEDFRPGNRFETARTVITRFIGDRPGDHIGLVGFSAEAALRVPPTLDHDYLRGELARMALMELGDGTAIGMGVALSALHLQAGGAEERVIVLLTDGVNNAGEISPISAAEAAASAGIRIYAIGVGSAREAPIEVRDPETGQLYRGIVRDSYDENALRRIAELSGGQYFTASSAGTLQAVFEAIGTAQTVERRVRIHVRREHVYREILMVALALLLLDFLLRRIVLRVAP